MWTYDPWGPDILDAISCDWTTTDDDKERCWKHCEDKIQPPCCKPKVTQCENKIGDDGMCHLVAACPSYMKMKFKKLVDSIWDSDDDGCP